MKTINRADAATGEPIELSYCDYGQGQPVVLIHGWPLSKEMWEYQLHALVGAGLRVIKYDRRGFGKSSKPWDNYDYDTLADDLNDIIEQLDLQNVVLVGFSMGGGEVVRYLSNHGDRRVAKIVLIGSVTPFLGKTDDNQDGVDPSVFQKMIDDIKEDRIGFLEDFGKKFFGVNLIKHPVSSAMLDYYCMLASMAPSHSTQKCIQSFAFTDFRKDLENIKVPALVIHGDSDQNVPIEVSGKLTAQIFHDCRYLVYSGAPHGLFYTHKDQLNEDLIKFIRENNSAPASASRKGAYADSD
jgi:non-heme chloroperoxidase